MLENWFQKYNKLTEYIMLHPEIKISERVVRIPETVRDQFNQLLWDTREEYVKERDKDILDRTEELINNYQELAGDTIKTLKLDDIDTFPDIREFLRNPVEKIVKELRNALMELLKGRISFAQYEEEAMNIFMATYQKYYQRVYELWLTLSLVKLLEADKLFRVDTEQFDQEDFWEHGGGGQAKVPEPDQTQVLSFKHNTEIGILVADQIIHSAKLNCYFSFKPHVRQPLGRAIERSKEREWFPLPKETLKIMDRNVFLVYKSKKIEDLNFIADNESICRPDLIIECVGEEKALNSNYLNRAKIYTQVFKPEYGTYVVSKEPILEGKQAEESTQIESEKISDRVADLAKNNIRLLPIGLSIQGLVPIIDLFVEKINNEQSTDSL